MTKHRKPNLKERRLKAPRERKKAKLSLTATSKRSGISHIFDDIDALQALAKSYISKRNRQFEADLVESLRLWNWLQSQPPIQADFLEWREPVYRIVYGGLHPLSIAGSLAVGGRFNLGGAQIIEEELFPNLQMGACLYAASSIECANAEAGSLVGKPELFRITPRLPKKLWKLENVLKKLGDPTLLEFVRKAPMSKRWALQKTPLFSQLIACLLRSIGGEGIIFPSTKLPTESVIAFFLRDDQQCLALFDLEMVS